MCKKRSKSQPIIWHRRKIVRNKRKVKKHQQTLKKVRN